MCDLMLWLMLRSRMDRFGPLEGGGAAWLEAGICSRNDLDEMGGEYEDYE